MRTRTKNQIEAEEECQKKHGIYDDYDDDDDDHERKTMITKKGKAGRHDKTITRMHY